MKISFKKIMSLMLALVLAATAVQLEQLSIIKAEDTACTTVSAADEDCLDYIRGLSDIKNPAEETKR